MIENPLSHNHFDVTPYYQFGNAVNDPTTQNQRNDQKWMSPLVIMGIK
ncbi:MAG: hypothetical protein IPP74_03225 [Alphaproteobacteria bacterium]|nr:hypothetical protein [Alphaproteobacteria bacterium]